MPKVIEPIEPIEPVGNKVIIPENFKNAYDTNDKIDFLVEAFEAEYSVNELVDGTELYFKSNLDKALKTKQNQLNFSSAIKTAVVESIESYFNAWCRSVVFPNEGEIKSNFPINVEEADITDANFLSICLPEGFNYLKQIFRYKYVLDYCSNVTINNYIFGLLGIESADLTKFSD